MNLVAVSLVDAADCQYTVSYGLCW